MIKGSIVALVTPMNSNGHINYEQLENLVEWHIQAGTQGIVVVGTTGESTSLTVEEAEKVIQKTVLAANKKLIVIAGTGNSVTQQTIIQTQRAQELGADAALIITPYYNRPTQEGLYLHYKAIADSVPDLPIILYNNPGRTGVDLKIETVENLSNIPNIYGIKDPTGDLNRVYEYKWRCGSNFKVYSGDDATCLNFMLAGGDGVISITANIVPKMMQELTEAALNKEENLARELNDRLTCLYQLLVSEPNPIPVKWALGKLAGLDSHLRLPLTPFSGEHHADMLEQFNLLGLELQLGLGLHS